MPVSKKEANYIVARMSGVKEGDNKIDAANKAIETMRMAGFPASAIRKAERLRDDAIRRGVK
jgi:hypothetical protein